MDKNMAVQGESLFALVRRRESIRALAQQNSMTLPSSLTENKDTSNDFLPETPAQKLQRDLATLDAKKKNHLVVPHRKGGKKLNRLSYFGLLLGLVIAGAVFFTAGYLMCLSVNPPNGGLIFEPKYETAAVGRAVSTSTDTSREDTEYAEMTPSVPQKSYVDRQALFARTNGRSKQTGLLEQSEKRTYENVKNQVKNTVSRGLRSLSQKFSDKLSPGLNQIVRPLTDELPQNLARTNLDDTFNHANNFEATSPSIKPTSKKSLKNAQADSTFSEVSSQKSEPSRFHTQQTELEDQAKIESQTQEETPTARQALYAIRIRRFNERLSALKLAEELKIRGYDSYVVSVWNNHGHFDFEVRCGAYVNYSETLKAKAVLQQVWQGPGIELPGVVMIRENEEIINP